jgi:hypothetical protein
MSRIDEHRKATALGVMDARDLIRAKYPALLAAMTSDQIDKVQRQLDADVINTAVDRELTELDGKSIVGRTRTGQPVRDPSKVASHDKILRLQRSKITVRSEDTVIRLDLSKVLAPDALRPISDNPDEASYLLQVKSALATRGVWFRVFLNRSQMAISQFTQAKDHRRWHASLWFGSDGRSEINTSTGQLTRQVILSVLPIGAGYYDYVHNGPTLRLLRNSVESVSSKLSWAMAWHRELDPDNASLRGRLLTWGMTELVANGMLGLKVKFPQRRVLEEPQQLLSQATRSIDNGKLSDGNKLLVLAAFQAESGINALVEYAKFIHASKDGVETALSLLQVAEKLGEIAGKLLFIRAIAGGLFRQLSRGGVTAATEGTGMSAIRPLPNPTSTTPTAAYQNTVQNVESTVQSVVPRAPSVPAPAARGNLGNTIANDSIPPARPLQPSSNGTWDTANRLSEEWYGRTGHLKFQRESKQYWEYVEREMRHLQKVNPKASFAEKGAIIEKADKAWGGWLPGDTPGIPARYWGEEINIDLVR